MRPEINKRKLQGQNIFRNTDEKYKEMKRKIK